MHHEFQHILNQNKPYPSSFIEISGLNYVEDEWSAKYRTTREAVTDGFISSYSSKSDKEDFAEIYSHYVTSTPQEFERILDLNGTNSTGKTTILSKLTFVKSYMISEWGIDMDMLRGVIQSKYNSLSTLDQTTLN